MTGPGKTSGMRALAPKANYISWTCAKTHLPIGVVPEYGVSKYTRVVVLFRDGRVRRGYYDGNGKVKNYEVRDNVLSVEELSTKPHTGRNRECVEKCGDGIIIKPWRVRRGDIKLVLHEFYERETFEQLSKNHVDPGKGSRYSIELMRCMFGAPWPESYKDHAENFDRSGNLRPDVLDQMRHIVRTHRINKRIYKRLFPGVKCAEAAPQAALAG